MASDDNKKITWKRDDTRDTGSSTADNQKKDQESQISDAPENSSTVPIKRSYATDPNDVPVMDVTARAVSHNSNLGAEPSNNLQVQSLKDEINQALKDVDAPKQDPNQSSVVSRQDDVVSLDAPNSAITYGESSVKKDMVSAAPVPARIEKKPVVSDDTTQNIASDIDLPGVTTDKKPETTVESSNDAEVIASLKSDISETLEQESVPADAIPKNNPAANSDKGIEQTYYSDLSQAMSSNEPATMSELIRKSRFEDKKKKVLSPKSKRNILFIIGAIVLLFVSIVILAKVFSPKEEITFISEEKVSSFIRSDIDTGINTTGLESARIKQAIREVVETKIPEDTINQIYYVNDDGLGNFRRLGIKDIFEKTDNLTPPLLYDNIENNFMHGVYKSDKNYPFIVMKSLSYDRAFEGMMEWEETMIDDLATYLDLPPEATDRSLIQDGFEDDLINNKNVRVARFLPRAVDKKGILDFLGIPDFIPKEETTEEDTRPDAPTEFQNEFEVNDDSINLNTISYAKDLFNSWFGSVKAYAQNNNQPNGFSNGGQNFNDAISGGNLDGGLTGGTTLELNTYAPVCFDRETGARINNSGTNATVSELDRLCFPSYECYEYSCFDGTTDVGPNAQNLPGAVCRDVTEKGTVFHPKDPVNASQSYPGAKSCYQFRELLALQNINDTVLCFSKSTGRYLTDYYPPNSYNDPDVSCLAPQQRITKLCVAQDGRVYESTGNDQNAQFCFTPYQEDISLATNCPIPGDVSCLATGDTGYDFTGDLCSEIRNGTDRGRQTLYQYAHVIRQYATVAQLLGLSSQDADNIRSAAQFLEQLANIDIIDETIPPDVLQTGRLIVQQLDFILNKIDRTIQIPGVNADGTLNAYGKFRQILEVIKCVLKLDGTIYWVNADQIPRGVTIYAGSNDPGVIPVQQTLVILGLLDEQSITGTLDLVTQDAIVQFQEANLLEVTGILDESTLELMSIMVQNQSGLFNGTGVINDYIPTDTSQLIGMGTYSNDVQIIQTVLFSEGYDISNINGVFDETMCLAVQQFQADNDLEVADSISCRISLETIDAINDIIRNESLLGSGFILNEDGSPGQGFLEGMGRLEGLIGPGSGININDADFLVNSADADNLNQGDVVLMYMFLDEETILITRDKIVVDEIIKRRAQEDIF